MLWARLASFGHLGIISDPQKVSKACKRGTEERVSVLELLVSVIVAVVFNETKEVVEVETARLVVLIGLKVEVGVMVVDKRKEKSRSVGRMARR